MKVIINRWNMHGEAWVLEKPDKPVKRVIFQGPRVCRCRVTGARVREAVNKLLSLRLTNSIQGGIIGVNTHLSDYWRSYE